MVMNDDYDMVITRLPSGVIKHGLLEKGRWIRAFPSETCIYRGFSIASRVADYQRVNNGSFFRESV